MPDVIARHYRSGEPLRLCWEGTRLDSVAPAAGAGGDAPWVAPALLDLQVNGYGGRDFSRPGHLGAVAADLATHGVARLLPTVITAPQDALEEALGALNAALNADPALRAAVPGLHLEGPYISPDDGPRGAHPRAHVRAPDWAHFCGLQRAAGGRIRLVTLAPELPGAREFTAAAVAAGLVVAIGHTAADTAAIAGAVDAGARLSTHLGNGLAATIDRHHNPLWPQLAEARLCASFIADGHHLPAPALRAMLAAKGTARCILVSDAVAHAGLPPGRYPGIGGAPVEVLEGGRVQLAGTPYLAGSGAHLATCVAGAVDLAGVAWADALDMAALHPARLLGLPAPRIEPGACADLLFYRLGNDGSFQVVGTVRAGALVAGVIP